MSRVPKVVFTQDYRADAVELVIVQGNQIAETARELGVSVKTYARWVCDARA